MAKVNPIKPISEKYVEAETVTDDSEISSLSNYTEGNSEQSAGNSILLVEPFYGGSHKQLIDILNHHLNQGFSAKTTCLFTMTGKKWHWRARTSALYFSRVIPQSSSYKILFCSSTLNLAELCALRTDLSKLYKIIYFHENQLVYPFQNYKNRDFQYGYNQILSCLVADCIVFNSLYNLNSFLGNIDKFLRFQPDYHIKNLGDEISHKSKVIYFPVEVPKTEGWKGEILHIIWPHRWEHDKNPQLFFEVLFKLKEKNISFLVSVLGESFSEVPPIFKKAKEILKDEILQFGRIPCKNEYYKFLKTGHVVVSTANHEFFGVAMLEAAISGCFPIACNNLVYPEIYPPESLYNTPNQLYKKLKNLCQRPYLAEYYFKKAEINFEKFSIKSVLKDFKKILLANHFLEGINKVRDLIKDLEESFRESNNINNNLILRCVLLRAENQSLIHKIDERRCLISAAYTKHTHFSPLSQSKNKLSGKPLFSNASKQLCPTFSKTSFQESVVYDREVEIDILHSTIEDLQKKLKEKEKKIEVLCEKYLYLKTNKRNMIFTAFFHIRVNILAFSPRWNSEKGLTPVFSCKSFPRRFASFIHMMPVADKTGQTSGEGFTTKNRENNLKSKIASLEKQLNTVYDALSEFQKENEASIEQTLSSSKNIYESQFLQEKLRCSKLIYEKIKLKNEIKKLEDLMRRKMLTTNEKEEEFWQEAKVDKSISEPLMRRF